MWVLVEICKMDVCDVSTFMAFKGVCRLNQGLPHILGTWNQIHLVLTKYFSPLLFSPSGWHSARLVSFSMLGFPSFILSSFRHSVTLQIRLPFSSFATFQYFFLLHMLLFLFLLTLWWFPTHSLKIQSSVFPFGGFPTLLRLPYIISAVFIT